MVDPAEILRPARPRDIAALAAVARRSYAVAFAGILTAEELAGRDDAYFADRFALTLDRLTVAERNGRPVGFALVSTGHIDMLFLDPDAAGTGLGRRLLAALEANGARSLECFAANRAARGFYEHLGWRLDDAYTRPYLGRDVAFVRYVRPDPPDTTAAPGRGSAG
jgi:putative acetyltransferase